MPNYNVDVNENKNGIEKDSPIYKAIKYLESVVDDEKNYSKARYIAAQLLLENHGLTYKILEPYRKPASDTVSKTN